MVELDVSFGEHKTAIQFLDSYECLQLGVSNSAEQQILKLKEYFSLEYERSRTFKELIDKIYHEYETTKENPIIFYVGKNSAGFIDSGVTWTFDVDDLQMLPEHYSPETGITRGESIVHVLEERMYMKKPDNNFNNAHFACLKKTSFQNRYREEMGGNGYSFIFNIDDREATELDYCLNGNRTKTCGNLVADFRSVSSAGAVTKLVGVPIGKGSFPNEYDNHDPTTVKVIHELKDFRELVETEISIIFEKFITNNSTKPLDVRELLHWVESL